jgi:hypothetical protein
MEGLADLFRPKATRPVRLPRLLDRIASQIVPKRPALPQSRRARSRQRRESAAWAGRLGALTRLRLPIHDWLGQDFTILVDLGYGQKKRPSKLMI